MTGASDGIGRHIARGLASRGFNVVLHGRNRAKLSNVMVHLQRDHPKTLFRILIADAGNVPCTNCIGGDVEGNVDFAAIADAVRDIHLTVLVNNAGAGPRDPVFSFLDESSESRITSNISLNALFPIHMARALLPQLKRNSPSLILNVSSLSDQGFPLIVSYSASKMFMANWTSAVGMEMDMSGYPGVEVLVTRIGKATGTAHNKTPIKAVQPDAETVARAILERARWGYGVVTAYWMHAVQEAGLVLLPAWARRWLFMVVMRGEQADELRRIKEA